MNEDKIIELEIRLTHQEKFSDDLSQVISAQARTIEKLERHIKEIHSQLVEFEEQLSAPAPQTKPPHW